MRTLANGIGINYDLSGPADAPVVAMSHSLGSSRVMWDPQLAALSTKYRVLRIDTRGHGLSDAPEGDYSLDTLADDAIALLDQLGIQKVHWVGLSMGGMIGQALGLRHPGRLLSLALCNTSSQIPQAAQAIWEERIAAARAKSMAGLADATMERWFTAPYREKKTPQLEQIRMEFLRTPVAGFVGCCGAIRRLDYTDRLIGIRATTLIIAGEHDQGTPLAASQVMHSRIAGSELVVLPVAHLSNIEVPDDFTTALMGFLGRH